VVYRADQTTDEVVELFSVPIAKGASPIQLSGPASSHVRKGLLLARDGGRVVYRADSRLSGCTGLFSAPLDGSASAALLHSAGQDAQAGVVLSADGARVLYRARHGLAARAELFGVSIDGGSAPVRLSAVLAAAASGAGAGVESFALSASGVAYLVDAQCAGREPLFWTTLEGALDLRLGAPLPEGGQVRELRVTADGARVVYLAEQTEPGLCELFVVRPAAPGEPVRLSQPALSNPRVLGGVSSFALAGERVVYRATQNDSRAHELFSARAAAPDDESAQPLRLNAPLVAGGDVERLIQFSSQTGRVVYVADQEEDERFELYSAPLAPLADAPRTVKLSGPLTAGGDVRAGAATQPGFRIAPGGRSVVYLADQRRDWQDELFVVPIDASAPPVLLTPLGVQRDVVSFELSPDGRRVVYSADQEIDQRFELYSVPLDLGGQPPACVRVAAMHARGGDVEAYRLSTDASRVVYRADQDFDDQSELYCAPLDGSSAPVKLNAPLAAWGDVRDFAITANGTRVVYQADHEADERVRLYSVAIDGSAQPIALDAPAERDPRVELVRRFELSPDGARVCYVDRSFGLWAAPVDGREPAVRLSSPPSGRGRVAAFQFTPDSARVLYLADRGDERSELFLVPAAGGTAARLSAPLSAQGSVLAFELSPDGRSAAYSACDGSGAEAELHVVPLDGGAPPIRVDDERVSHGSVNEFGFTPDGRSLVYSAGPDTHGSVELFASDLSRALAAPLDLAARRN